MKKSEKIILVLCVIIFLISGKYLIDYMQDSYENRVNYERIEDTAFPEKNSENHADNQEQEDASESRDFFDYQSLAEQNTDCIGWLSIAGTDISYPVVQGRDNDYYLRRNFQKQDAVCGTLFLDYRNDPEQMQEHLIIYGHQMKDGSMFKQLNGYKAKDFYNEHKEITLYLRNRKHQYEVAAVYVTNVAESGGYYDFLHKETRKQQMEYLQKMAAYRLYSTDVTVDQGDELLSLSTCEYSSENGRLIVLARRLP